MLLDKCLVILITVIIIIIINFILHLQLGNFVFFYQLVICFFKNSIIFNWHFPFDFIFKIIKKVLFNFCEIIKLFKLSRNFFNSIRSFISYNNTIKLILD